MTKQETKIEGAALNVHRKLSLARQKFHSLELKKSGHNKFAGYKYFELGDFIIPALSIFDEIGLSATVSFTADLASMTITDMDEPDEKIVLTSPMGSAALKGCHEVQNVGAVETYQRRYLWTTALEIVEHDALDATTGKEGPEQKAAKPKGNSIGAQQQPGDPTASEFRAMLREVHRNILSCGDPDELDLYLATDDAKTVIDNCQRRAPHWWEYTAETPPDFKPLMVVIDDHRRDLKANEKQPITAAG